MVFRQINKATPFYEPQLPLRVVPFENTYAIVDSMGMIIANGLTKQIAEEFLEHQALLGQTLAMLRDWAASDSQHYHDYQVLRSPNDDTYNELVEEVRHLLMECKIKVPTPKTKIVNLKDYVQITNIKLEG